ncbi:hypothetical protein H009_19507 [Agrobacterium tumefaciens str. Cherry 2E-2-2]|nr:hypothetical protein H009_19507 [Agrobacterium tumefaciens str. Cherry 2E-2-2]
MSTPTTIPTHHVFVVDGEGTNAFWTKIGAAWRHADGKGFNMTLNAIPLDGRVVVRSVKAAEERTGKGRN